MKSKSTKRMIQLLAGSMLGGALLVTGCTMRDLQTNLVAGTLAYVKSEATTFWSQVFSVEDWTNGAQ